MGRCRNRLPVRAPRGVAAPAPTRRRPPPCPPHAGGFGRPAVPAPSSSLQRAQHNIGGCGAVSRPGRWRRRGPTLSAAPCCRSQREKPRSDAQLRPCDRRGHKAAAPLKRVAPVWTSTGASILSSTATRPRRPLSGEPPRGGRAGRHAKAGKLAPAVRRHP